MVRESPQVSLRLAEVEDASLVRGWFNQAGVRQLMPISPFPVTAAEEEKILAMNGSADYIYFVVVDNSDNELGFVGLHSIDSINQRARTVTLIGKPEDRGRGLATEARSLVIDFAFNELNLGKVLGGSLACNRSARSLVQKNGAVPQSYHLRHHYANGEWHDFIEYALFKFPENALASTIPPDLCWCESKTPSIARIEH